MLGLGFVADCFDVMPVRANDESRVVLPAVLWAQTRRTVVFAARLKCSAIESVGLTEVLASLA
jgi:hypothetical protein